jgi:hypothetical protein
LSKTDGNFIVGDGTDWVVESGATARASLGLIIGTDVQADLDLVPQAEAEAGTATTERVWNAERVKQAIAALETGGGGLSDLVDDLTPQLGGDLDLNSKNIDFPSTPNISDCLDEDTLVSDSAIALATQQSIKAYVDSTTGLGNLVEDITPQLGGDLDLNGKNLDFPTTPNISDVLDEDNMASNSATKLATQQSIKAYVDTSGGGLPAVDTTSIVEDPADATKEMRIDVGAVATATIRVLTMPDQDIDLTPVSGTFQSSLEYENVVDHGAVNDGTTDNVTAFAAAQSASSSGTVYVPAGGEYFLNTWTVTTDLRLIGPGTIVPPKTTPFLRYDGPAQVTGDHRAITAVAVDTSINDMPLSKITCVVTGYKFGDVVSIRSFDNYPWATSNEKAAELATIAEVGVGFVILNKKLHDHDIFDGGTNPKIVKLADTVLVIDGPKINIKSTDDPLLTTGRGSDSVFDIRAAVRPRIRCQLFGAWNRGLFLYHCWAPEVELQIGPWMMNRSAATQILGYGCILFNGTEGARVSVRGEGCRHICDTGQFSVTSETNDNFFQWGAPKNNLFYNCVSINCYETSYSTHRGARNTTFMNCVSINSVGTGLTGSAEFTGGMINRGLNTKVFNFLVIGSERGVFEHSAAKAYGEMNRPTYDGLHVEALTDPSVITTGLIVFEAEATAGDNVIHLRNATFTGPMDRGMTTWPNAAPVLAENIRFTDCVTPILQGTNQRVDLRGAIFDYRGAISSPIELVRGDDGSVLNMTDWQVIGTSGEGPSNFFTNDDVSTCTVRLGKGRSDYQPTAIYKSGDPITVEPWDNIVDPQFQTFTANDTTPDVSRGKLFKTNNNTSTKTITMLDGGVDGAMVRIIINDAFTAVDFTGTNLKGNGGADWSPTSGDHMTCVFDGTDWYCDISDNTA